MNAQKADLANLIAAANKPVLPRLAGKLLIKSMEPSSTRKVKAPKRFQPAESDISASIINNFVDQQGKLVEKMKASDISISKGSSSPHRFPRRSLTV